MVRDYEPSDSRHLSTLQSYIPTISQSNRVRGSSLLKPAFSLLFVASLFEDQPMLVDISESNPVKRRLPSAPKRSRLDGEELSEKQAAQDAKQNTCVTVFTSLGTHIIAGTNKGWLNIIETESCQVLYSTRLCNNGIIILLRLTASGRELVSNSSDRVIRTIPIPDLSQSDLDVGNINLEVEHKFQDVVNKLAWNHVAFSSTGEYVTASTYMNHDIYVWERSHGSLVKILEGPREELGVIEVTADAQSLAFVVLSHADFL